MRPTKPPRLSRLAWRPVLALAALLVIGRADAQLLTTDYTGRPFDVIIDGSKYGTTPARFNAQQIFTVGEGAAAKRYRLSLYPVTPIGRANGPEERRTPTPGPASINSPNYEATLRGFRDSKWTFRYADAQGRDFRLSNGSLVVKSYSTVVVPDNGVDATHVGADLFVEYRPNVQQGDPAKDRDLHWIQVLHSNWSITGKPGDTENLVDNGGQPFRPYYDGSLSANQDFFWDQPLRLTKESNAELNNYDFSRGPLFWTAELFLVKEVGSRIDEVGVRVGEVNVYDGLRWGWRIDPLAPIPEPRFVQLGALLAGGGLWVLRAWRQREKRRATVQRGADPDAAVGPARRSPR